MGVLLMPSAPLPPNKIRPLRNKRHVSISLQNNSDAIFYEQPLGDADIRFVLLEPGNFDDPIRCRLFTSRPPKEDWTSIYIALSYERGDTTFKQMIVVNNRLVAVPRNLMGALRYVRQMVSRVEKDLHVMLWVADLCLNQADPSEKARHVENFRSIWSHASLEILWVPPEDDEFAQAARDHLVQKGEIEPEYRPALPGVKHELTSVPAIDHIVNSTVWTRQWIAAELATCQYFAMLVGPMAIAGGTLEWLVDGASSANEISYRGPNTAIARVCNMLAFRKTCSTMKICSDNPKEKYASSVFFAELAGMKTTELNDKVYSVLGFMCKDWRPNYKPDYSKPFEVVSQEVMECVTSCDHDAGFLWKFDRLVDDPAACRDPSSVPSWVPNLRRKTPNLMEYYACGEEKPLKTSVIEGPQMRIPGWIISPVDRVVGPLTADQKILNDEFGRLINDAKSRAPHIEMLLEVHQRFAQCMRREWSKTTPESRSARFNGIMSDFFCADDVGSPTAERIWEIWEVVVKALQIRSPKWFEELIQDFLQGFSFYFARMEGRCYFETKSGYCGLGPSDTKREDVVAVFELCECPILLRKIKSKKAKQQNYTVVGPAYLDHAMDGEYANPEKREIIRLR